MAPADDFRTHYLREAGICPPLARMGAPTANLDSAIGMAADGAEVVGLEELAVAVSRCQSCALAAGRTQTVFGVGNPHARLLFVGEAPGREEDLRGEPFVGRAGKLLDRMLAAMDLDRSQVYIMNVVKCRPPENRNPEAAEISACAHWFDAQWQAISPQVVCLLGKVAAQSVLGSQASMASLRGRWHESRGAKVRATYHPAYLLRSPQQKAHVWQDLQEIGRACRQAASQPFQQDKN
jgi:uracil-DNA glycosylase